MWQHYAIFQSPEPPQHSRSDAGHARIDIIANFGPNETEDRPGAASVEDMGGPICDDPIPCLNLAGLVRPEWIARNHSVLVCHPPNRTISDGIDGRLAKFCKSIADGTKIMKQSARVTTFDCRLVANFEWLDDFAIRCVRFACDCTARAMSLRVTLAFRCPWACNDSSTDTIADLLARTEAI